MLRKLFPFNRQKQAPQPPPLQSNADHNLTPQRPRRRDRARDVPALKTRVEADMNASFKQHKLCSICQSIVSQSKNIASFGAGVVPKKESVEYYAHYPSLDLLEKSALGGCHFCTLLLECDTSPGFLVRIHFYENTGSPDAGRNEETGWIETYDPTRTICRIKLSDYDNFTYSLHFEKTPDVPSYSPRLSLSTGSDACFNRAREWLHDCMENHPECRSQEDSMALPTRVLDLSGVASAKCIKLSLTANLPATSSGTRPAYLALSHRWGDIKPLCLLKENLSQFMDSIPLEVLPRTFRDAVTATERFGFRYLWIDSLCIIQDSAKDWEHESALMGDVYRGCVFTIAALGAMDSTQGLFQIRNPLFDVPCYIGSNVTLEPGRRQVTGDLMKRGWVFQERVLSPRTLHYGSTTIAWECVKERHTEHKKSSLVGYTRRGGVKDHFRNLHLHKEHLQQLNTPSDDIVKFYSAWSRLCTEYSSTKITFSNDKLIAVNGIITEVARRTGLTPVAGLWKELLCLELLWHVDPSTFPTIDYRAPSWSWASSDLDGSFTTMGGRWKYFNFQIEASEVYAPASQNGLLTDRAYLGLTGPIREISRSEISLRYRSFFYQDGSGRPAFYVDGKPLLDRDEDGSIEGVPDLEKGFDLPKRTMFALWVRRAQRCQDPSAWVPEGKWEKWALDEGLILERVPNKVGTYRRLGYYSQEYRTPSGCPDGRKFITRDLTLV